MPPPVAAPAPAIAPLPPVAAPKPVKLQVRAALLVPLSGQYASWGNALSNAAQMAVFDVADANFSLVPIDSKGTAEGAAAAARLAFAQGADILLGPIFSPEVKAAAPVALEHRAPVLAFTTDRSAAGSGVYVLGITPKTQVERVVSYARVQGKNRFAILAPASEAGRQAADALKATVTASGAQLSKVEFYDPSAHDVSPTVKKFTDYESRTRGRTKETTGPVPPPPFDAVLLPDTGTRLRSVASMVAYYEVDPSDVRMLGTMLWDDAKLTNEPALAGGWYPAPPATEQAAFDARYAKLFGALPSPQLGNLASLAYDATALAARLAHDGMGDFPAEALTNPGGFAGAVGIFRLLPDGTTDRGLAIREMAKGGAREIAPAPTSFPAARM